MSELVRLIDKRVTEGRYAANSGAAERNRERLRALVETKGLWKKTKESALGLLGAISAQAAPSTAAAPSDAATPGAAAAVAAATPAAAVAAATPGAAAAVAAATATPAAAVAPASVRNARLRHKTMKQLKAIARSSGMIGYSTRKRRSNLIKFMTEHGANLVATPPEEGVGAGGAGGPPPCEGEGEGGEEECDAAAAAAGACDGRGEATKDNDIREKLLYRCFKGDATVTDAELAVSFACAPAHIRTLVAELTATYPTFQATVIHMGGQSNNYDYKFTDGAGAEHKIELKSSKSVINKAELERVPWKSACQLLQVYLDAKDEKYGALFASFDVAGLWTSWFETVVRPVLMPAYGIADPIDFRSYFRLATTKSVKAAQAYIAKVLADKGRFERDGMTVGAIRLFQFCHSHRTPPDNQYREGLWHGFLEGWLAGHRFADAAVFQLVRETLNKKTSWICTGSNGAYLIQGPTCTGVAFREVKREKKATKLQYECAMVHPAYPPYSITIKVNFYWKNGGQGVHGLCLQLQPA